LRWLAGPRRTALYFAATLLLTPAIVWAQGSAAPAASDISSFARAKAEALLHDQLPCLGCHTLDGKGGKLAPELATVRTRRDAAYVARVVADPQATVRGTLMPHTPMPREWRALVVRYLGGDASIVDAAGAAPRIDAAASADSTGAALYARYCTGCHGPQGKGDGPNAASLPVPPARHASKDAMSARPDDALYDTIAGGGAIMNRSPRMPAYGTTLSPAQIRALVRHIRSLCQCQGPTWSTDGQASAK
jgi:mono/diheme cytochrome c family protein